MSVYEVGGATAVVTLDQRHRRAPHQILPLEHYMDIALLGPSLPEVGPGGRRLAAACGRQCLSACMRFRCSHAGLEAVR